MFLGSNTNFERQTFVHRCCYSQPTGAGLVEPERPPRSHRCSRSVLLTVLSCQLCFTEFTFSSFVQLWQGYGGFNAVKTQLFSIQDTFSTLFENSNISKIKGVMGGLFSLTIVTVSKAGFFFNIERVHFLGVNLIKRFVNFLKHT